MFVIVVFAALKFAWDARVDYVTAEMQQKTADNDRLRKETREAQKREEDTARAELKAQAFYELVRQGKRVEVADTFESTQERTHHENRARGLHRRRRPRAKRARRPVLPAGTREGPRAEVAGRPRERSRTPSTPRTTAPSPPTRSWAPPTPSRHLNRQRDAIPLLTQLTESTYVDKELQDDALYALAYCQTEIQAWNDAKNTWRGAHPALPGLAFHA